jgi:cysteinyl-tRNA synthetase
MHKSIGNTYLIRDLEERGFDPLAFRLLALTAGYRSRLDFTWTSMEDAARRLEKWRSAVAGATQSVDGPSELSADDPIRLAFVDAITDDLNTPKALAAAESAIALLHSPERDDRRRGLALVFDMDRVLGLDLRDRGAAAAAVDPDVRPLLDERDRARKAGDFKKSDALREELRIRGYLVKDTKEGQRWERVRKKKD